MLLGSLIRNESDEENVILLFKSRCGECRLGSLPEDIKVNLPTTALSLDVHASMEISKVLGRVVDECYTSE